MNILLLTMYFAPDSGANATLITELAEGLAAKGHRVTVVCAFPHYAENRIVPSYRGALFRRRQHGIIRVFSTYLYVPQNKTSLFGRLLNYLSFNILSTLAGLVTGEQDVILVPSPPLTIGLTGWLLSVVKRAPFIYNVQDIYPDIAIRLGVLKNRYIIAVFRWLEKFVYTRAKAISVLSEGFRQNLLAKGVSDAKLHIIPNFIDTDFITPQSKNNPFAAAHGLADKFVVMYAGNIGLSQGLETLLDAAALLQDIPDLCILIVGNGAAKNSLVIQATEQDLGNLLFLPFQDQAQLPEMYGTADVALVIIKAGISAESVPSKTYTIMASGRPIVAAIDEGSEVWNLIHEADCGVCVAPEKAAALADAIRSLYEDQERARTLGENGRRHVQAHYAKPIIVADYERLLIEISGQKGVRAKVVREKIDKKPQVS